MKISFFSKILIIFNIIMLILSFFIGCSSNNKSKTNEYVISDAKLSKIYKSLDELKNDSSDIIEAKIIDNDVVMYDGIPFTISRAEVQSVIKTNTIKKGDTIKVLETGGLLPDGKVYRFDGTTVMKKSEHVFLFLEPYKGPITKDSFVIKGAYQGKFKIQDNSVIQEGKDDIKIKELKNETLKSFLDKIEK